MYFRCIASFVIWICELGYKVTLVLTLTLLTSTNLLSDHLVVHYVFILYFTVLVYIMYLKFFLIK